MNPNPLLTIVIVTWNSERDIRACLKSIFQSNLGSSVLVTVVDNDSRDKTRDIIRSEFPNVRLLESSINLGFAKANNLAFADIKTQYTLLLNPDTEVSSDAVTHMIGILESQPGVSMVGPRLILPSGRIQPESARDIPRLVDYFFQYTLLTMIGYTLFAGKIFCQAYLGTTNRSKSRIVPAISGAAMLVRTSDLTRVGPLDEQFFFAGEDLDYCIRFGKLGNVYYDAEAVIRHNQGSSMRQSLGSANLETYFSDERLFRKYHSSGAGVFRLIVRITYPFRLLLLSFIELIRGTFSLTLFSKSIKNYGSIIRWKSPIRQ